MQMENENKIISPEEEVSLLKERITQLEGESEEKTLEKGRKELTKRAVREYAEQNPEEILDERYKASKEEVKREAERVAKLNDIEGEHEETMRELLQIVEDKGILNAITIVRDLNDPHLEDDFHDTLVAYLQMNES